MPNDENTAQNQDSVENSIPPSPQEPTADAPILPMDSEPANAPSEALESSPNDFSVKSNDIPSSNSTPIEAVNEQKTEEKSIPNEPNSEPVSEPVQTIEPSTAQIPVNEPLENETETSNEQAKPVRKQSKITNDEVEKFLHVSDATATRYLSILEKEGRIKQNGKTGHMVSYSRI